MQSTMHTLVDILFYTLGKSRVSNTPTSTFVGAGSRLENLEKVTQKLHRKQPELRIK